MSISLVNNLGSLESQSRLSVTGSKLNATIQRLSSGLRINNSGDDAAGLAIANKYRSDIAILSQGVRNANDGLSTLQIIDGGLNTISNLLDRAASLAAQSASDTFAGDRDTLQSEFGKVLDEITRQARSIGLVSGGNNNKLLTTIIGGGTDSFAAAGTNHGVEIDLSSAGNRVDAQGLGLANTRIGASTGTVGVSGSNGLNFLANPNTALAAETLTFRYIQSDGTLTTYTVATGGAAANSFLTTLQNDATLAAAGIQASLDANGKLQFTSSNLFTVDSNVAAGAGNTGIGTTETVSSSASYITLSGGAATTDNTETQEFTFVGANGTIGSVQITTQDAAADNVAALVAAINASATLRDAGIYAIDNGTDVRIVSNKTASFSVNVEQSSGGTAENGFAVGTTSATAGVGVGGASGAKQVLDLIDDAVAALGRVQGVVGAGQNRLRQAIELATSQITSFQSAESRIRDADVSAEASNLARLSVLQQAGVAALAQANQASQAVLSLLR